jgi:hypothetical protein
MVEPTGIEPVTSCLQSARSPANLSAEKGQFAGALAAGLAAKIGAYARGLSAIVVVSGTSGDECLDEHRSVATG